MWIMANSLHRLMWGRRAFDVSFTIRTLKFVVRQLKKWVWRVCFVSNINSQLFTSNRKQIDLLYPHAGYVEIDPNAIWPAIVKVIRNAISSASLSANDIAGLGISTQRSTFITWDRKTGETFHNFITWKDLRADPMVRKWNSSVTLKVSDFPFGWRTRRKQNCFIRSGHARCVALFVYDDTKQEILSRKCFQIDESTNDIETDVADSKQQAIKDSNWAKNGSLWYLGRMDFVSFASRKRFNAWSWAHQWCHELCSDRILWSIYIAMGQMGAELVFDQRKHVAKSDR